MELAQQNGQASPDLIQQLSRLLPRASFAYGLHLLERCCDLELHRQPTSVSLLGVSNLSFPATSIAEITIHQSISVWLTFANLLSSDSPLHAILMGFTRLDPLFQATCHVLTSRLLLYRYLAWQQSRPHFGTSTQQHTYRSFSAALTATDPILKIAQLQTQSQLQVLQHSLSTHLHCTVKINLVDHWGKLVVAGLSSNPSLLRLGTNSICGQQICFANNLIQIVIDANDWQCAQYWLPGKQSGRSLMQRFKIVIPPWLAFNVELRFELSHLNKINLGDPTSFLGWNSGVISSRTQNKINVRKFIVNVLSD